MGDFIKGNTDTQEIIFLIQVLMTSTSFKHLPPFKLEQK